MHYIHSFISLHSLHTLLDSTASILFTYNCKGLGMLKLHTYFKTYFPNSCFRFPKNYKFVLSCVAGLVARSHPMSYPNLVQWWPGLRCQFGGTPHAEELMNHQPMYLQRLILPYCSRTTVPERVNKVSRILYIYIFLSFRVFD